MRREQILKYSVKKTSLCIFFTDFTTTGTLTLDVSLPCPFHFTMEHRSLPSRSSSLSLRANTTKRGCPPNYHLGELLHLGQRAQDVSVEVHGFLPGSVCHRDQAPAAGSPTLLLAFVRSAAGAATLRLGTRGPWGRPAGLQQGGAGPGLQRESEAQHSCAGPGWPQRACRWSLARVLQGAQCSGGGGERGEEHRA